MLEDIQAALPLGFLLSFMVGPVFFVLLETSVLKGFRAALCFNFGVITADIFFILLAYFSSYKLLKNLSNEPGLFIFGGAILLLYGTITFFKKSNKVIGSAVAPRTKADYLGLFIKGFLLNFINVGVLVFWLGVILIVGPSMDNEPTRLKVFFATMLLTYFLIDLIKIVLAKQLKNKLTNKRIRLVKRGMGLVLIICGVVLILKGLTPKGSFNFEERLEHIANVK